MNVKKTKVKQWITKNNIYSQRKKGIILQFKLQNKMISIIELIKIEKFIKNL